MSRDDADPVHRARDRLVRVAAAVHRGTRALCCALLLSLLGAQLLVVLLRYGLGSGRLELQDLSAYLFAALVMLALPVALADDRHVRVDVLRERQGARLRQRWDTTGTLLLLTPALLLTVYHVAPDVLYAWQIREGSRETGGLGGVYLVKTLLPVSCALMLLQAFARMASPITGSR